MWKIAIAYLLRPTHAAVVKSDPAFFLSSRSLATRSKYAIAITEDAKVGALSETAIAASEIMKAMEKKAPRPKKDQNGCAQQDSRGAEGLLHAEISIKKEKTRTKANKIKADACAIDPACVATMKKAIQPKGIAVFEAENETVYVNAAVGKTEDLALCAKANANRCSAREDLTKIIAKLNLDTYKYGSQWKETAYKLLDYGIPLAHISAMMQRCRTLPCSTHWVDSRLKYFALLGMSHQQIGRTISRSPIIFNVSDSMFRCKIEFWESMGVDRHCLGKILLATVRPITLSLSSLRRNATIWKDYMRDVHTNAVSIMMSKNPQLLSYSFQRTLPQKLKWLEAQDYDKKWLLRHPLILHMSLSTLASKAGVLARLGISDTRKRSWVLSFVFGLEVSKLQARFDNLLTAGFSHDQVRAIILKCPPVLSCTEEHVNSKINYAVNVMKASLDAIVSSPDLWSRNLETRIKPRYEVIKMLKAVGALRHNVGLGYLIRMSDVDFNRRFVERFQHVVKQPDALSA